MQLCHSASPGNSQQHGPSAETYVVLEFTLVNLFIVSAKFLMGAYHNTIDNHKSLVQCT